MTTNTEDLAAGIMGMSGQPYEVMLYRATKAIDKAIAAAVQAETTRCAELAQSMIGATRREIADAIRARKDVTK